MFEFLNQLISQAHRLQHPQMDPQPSTTGIQANLLQENSRDEENSACKKFYSFKSFEEPFMSCEELERTYVNWNLTFRSEGKNDKYREFGKFFNLIKIFRA